MGCSPWGREESDTTERLHFHFSLACIGEGNGNPLQCSCLESPRDGGAWWAAVYGVAQSRTRLSDAAAAAYLCQCRFVSLSPSFLPSLCPQVCSLHLQLHRWQPTRLPRPWDSPGKNAGVGCHFLLQCMQVKSESEVTQLGLTLSDRMDCSLPGPSICGIVQARILEWGATAFSGRRG